MKLGANTVVFGGSSLETALQHLEWAGYRYVELAAIKGMCDHVDVDTDPEALKDLLAKYHLQPTAMEAATQDAERLAGLFKLAKAVGFDIVNIGPGGKTGDEETTQHSIRVIRELAKMAGDHGIRLAVKPHVGNSIYNAATGLRLLEEVPETSLGLNFDPSHLIRANDQPQEVAKLWAHRTITSHFRDCPWREAAGPGTPEQQVPGRGIVDIPATLAALKASGYHGPLNLEVIGAGNFETSRAMGIAAEARGYLHRCLQEVGVDGSS